MGADFGGVIALTPAFLWLLLEPNNDRTRTDHVHPDLVWPAQHRLCGSPPWKRLGSCTWCQPAALSGGASKRTPSRWASASAPSLINA